MIQRLDCMKSLLHLCYKHGTASAKSLRDNGLRIQPGLCDSTFFVSNILLLVNKLEDGGRCSREEERVGFGKKKSFSENSSLFFKTKLFLHLIILKECFVPGVLN